MYIATSQYPLNVFKRLLFWQTPKLQHGHVIRVNYSYVLIYYVQTNVSYLLLKYPQNQVQQSMGGLHADPKE